MSTLKVTNIKSANGTSALSIADTSGNVTVGTGKVFAPNGIVFSSTELTGDDASTTTRTESSNVLDDYEEGTWTPTFTDVTGSPTGTARYIKVGRLVTLTFEQTGGTFTCTGSVGVISGIPFLGIGGSGVVSACGAISNTGVTSVLALYNASSIGTMYVTETFSSAGGVGFSITYQTS